MINVMNRPAPTNKLGNSNIQPLYDNSAETQRTRILCDFRNICPRLTTIEIRDEGILHPPGRIKEMREQGHCILTHWVRRPDANAVMHRVGMYIYFGKTDFTNLSWDKIVKLLPDDARYEEMSVDKRYVVLEKLIPKKLPPPDHEKAVHSLRDFLNYRGD